MKKALLYLFSIFVILISLGFSRGDDLRVITDEAFIYAEPNSGSYMIEKVGKGTRLTLFQPKKIREMWYYIAFYSEKRKGRVSGFIQDVMVEEASGVQDVAKKVAVERKELSEEPSLPESVEKKPLPSPEQRRSKTVIEEEPLVIPLSEMGLSVTGKGRAKLEMPIIAYPTVESIAFEKKEKNEIPSAIKIETVPDIDPSPMKDVVAFQEISEPPVEIEEKKMPAVNPPPSKKTEAFQETAKPPVKIKTEPLPSVSPSPTKDATAFQRIEETPEIVKVKEELATTSVLPTEKEKEYTREHIFTASPKREVVAYQERIEPPVEIEVKKMSMVSPKAQMEAGVFHREEEEKLEIHPEASAFSSPIKTDMPRISKPQEEVKIETMEVPPQRVGEGFRLITIGVGYGLSQGGVGGFLQYNTKAGFSVHGGVGYYPTTYIYSEAEWVENVVLFNGGLKYYLPLESSPIRIYLDVQYGGIGVEAAQVITGIWNYAFIFENRQITLWGPSFLVGAELRKGRIGVNGAVGFSYNMTQLDWEIQDIFLTFDIGLLFYF